MPQPKYNSITELLKAIKEATDWAESWAQRGFKTSNKQRFVIFCLKKDFDESVIKLEYHYVQQNFSIYTIFRELKIKGCKFFELLYLQAVRAQEGSSVDLKEINSLLGDINKLVAEWTELNNICDNR